MIRTRNPRSSRRKPKQQPMLYQRSVPRPLALEVKGFDAALTTSFLAAGVLSGDFSQLAAAGGVEDRVGLRVTYSELQFRISVQGTVGAGGPAGVGSNYLARLIIIQTTRQGLAIADVLDNTLGINVYSAFNIANVGQSKGDASVFILYDKTVNLNPSYHSCSHDEWVIPGRDLPIPNPRWASSAGLAPVHGGLQLILLTNQTVAGNFPTLQGSMRALFTDA